MEAVKINYHNILKDDMRNGDGLRVVLFVSGCDHYCDECQNPQTWNSSSGIEFDVYAKEELFSELSKDYISGITFSGGDPLNEHNVQVILNIIKEIRNKFGDSKTIWLYSGYIYEDIVHCQTKHDEIKNKQKEIIEMCDVMVDGPFEKDKADVNYHWAGSTNQRVIDIKETIKTGKIVLHSNILDAK